MGHVLPKAGWSAIALSGAVALGIVALSRGEPVRSEMGPVAGAIALIGVLMIMVILLAVLALVVVKALAGSPWGAFTVFATIPIAILMGAYGRFIRAGRIGEMSLIGFVLLM